MELLQLKYFCDAARTENFSRTAKKYLVPTSNISQSIKRLEAELGRELFEHRANKIVLNDDGRAFFSDVSRALSLIDGAKERASEGVAEISGDIRLVCRTNRRTVTRAIEEFIGKHPRVNFIIHHSLEDEGDFDVYISDLCAFEYSERRLIIDEGISVAMSGSHPLASSPKLSLCELKQERFITMTSGSSLYDVTTRLANEAGFTPNIAIQTDDPFYLRKYIEMGLGIALVPEKSWDGLFPAGVVLRHVEGARRKTYAYLPRDRYLKRSVEMFLDELQNAANR
ncbi:MAG: LysR family transcriptional regulator [Clostridia bacterium]|nr:LysR family transcriptional regulator [Clostridia bacterium]